jgi:hypothetical protein
MEAFCRKIQASLDYAENHVDVSEEKNVEPPDDPDMAQALAASNASMKLQEKEKDNIRLAMAASLSDNNAQTTRVMTANITDNNKQQEETKSELQKQLKSEISIEHAHGKHMYLCGGFKFGEIRNGKILILGAHPTEEHIKTITEENTKKFNSKTYTLSSNNTKNFTLENDLFIWADLNHSRRLMNIFIKQQLQFNRIIMDWSVLKYCSETWIYPNADRDNIWNSIHSILTNDGEIIIPRNIYSGIVDEKAFYAVRDLKQKGIFDSKSGDEYLEGLLHLNRMKFRNSTFDEFEKFIAGINKFDIKRCSVDHQVKFPMKLNKYAGDDAIKYFYVLTKK